ncbi:MAG: hypothetical protein ABRQ39_23070 [Candidatus Eremiobacterota bacterium]
MNQKHTEERTLPAKPFAYFLVQKGMEEEIEYFKDIIRLSEEQKSALQNSNMEIANKLIHEKQKLMEQIDRIEKKISPARNMLKSNMSLLSRDVIVQLRTIHGTLQATMEDVKNKDGETIHAVTKLKDDAYKDIINLRNHSKVISKNYFPHKDKTPVPYFFDRKS